MPLVEFLFIFHEYILNFSNLVEYSIKIHEDIVNVYFQLFFSLIDYCVWRFGVSPLCPPLYNGLIFKAHGTY